MTKNFWVILLMMLTSVQALVAWDGGGSGTSSDPYLISDATAWRNLYVEVVSGNTFSGAEGIISSATSGGKITIVDGKYAGALLMPVIEASAIRKPTETVERLVSMHTDSRSVKRPV